jgi:hypothetical protein
MCIREKYENSSSYLPYRGTEDTASPSLPRVRSKPVQLHPWFLGSAASSTFATRGLILGFEGEVLA